MEFLWPVLALVFSFCGAVIVGFNHWAKLDGGRLVVLRWFGVVPFAGLAWLVLPWPTHWDFYAVAAGMGVLLALSDKLLFDAAAKHGGRLAAMYIPMKMLLGFMGWAALQPESVQILLVEPWRGTLVLVGFALCSGALMGMRRQDASWLGLVAVMPVAVLLALGDIVAKTALAGPEGGLAAVIGGAVAFLLMTNSVGALVGLCMSGALRGRFAWPDKREVLLSAAFGAILVVSLSVFLVTLAIAPNPGYVGAITMLSTLWLSVYGYYAHGERANWWSGIVLLAGAVLVAVGGA